MKLHVDHAQRYAKMRAHTAAHLLHAELVKIFPATKQAGSLVDEDYLRFDFVADRALSTEELFSIQKHINHIIYCAVPVETIETSFDEAVNLGAKAFFEDKYGDVVRMVKVDQDISTELCGGTHVANTRDIGCFALLSQEAVASGIKRISAVVGPKVFDQVVERDTLLDTLASKLGVGAKQLVDKVEKTLKEFDSIKSSFESLETKYIADMVAHLDSTSSQDLQKIVCIPSDVNFKVVIGQARILFSDQTVLLATKEGNFALLGSSTVSAKTLAAKLGLKGGGSDQMVQGRDPQVVSFLS